MSDFLSYLAYHVLRVLDLFHRASCIPVASVTGVLSFYSYFLYFCPSGLSVDVKRSISASLPGKAYVSKSKDP